MSWMKEQSPLQIATAKRWLKRAAPPMFAVLKTLNQRREQLWTSPLVYCWRARCFALKERCTGFPAFRQKFLEKNGYEINLKSPRSFNEKISWLKLQPVTRLQVKAVDKVSAKQLALAWAKENGLELQASRTLAVVDRPSDIPWDSLPSRVVLKATHGSGSVHFVDRDRGDLSVSLEPLLESWLQYPYGVYKHEWVYWPVRRRLLVEEWLDADRASGLVDYKFHMSCGKCLAIQVNEGFQSGERTRAILTPDWQPHDVFWIYPRPVSVPECPPNLAEMLKVAKAFSRDFSYIRIDLYNLPRRGRGLDIYFGEFTFFPASGCVEMRPRSFDFWLGDQIVLRELS
jgi:hypothetical protein